MNSGNQRSYSGIPPKTNSMIPGVTNSHPMTSNLNKMFESGFKRDLSGKIVKEQVLSLNNKQVPFYNVDSRNQPMNRNVSSILPTSSFVSQDSNGKRFGQLPQQPVIGQMRAPNTDNGLPMPNLQSANSVMGYFNRNNNNQNPQYDYRARTQNGEISQQNQYIKPAQLQPSSFSYQNGNHNEKQKASLIQQLNQQAQQYQDNQTKNQSLQLQQTSTKPIKPKLLDPPIEKKQIELNKDCETIDLDGIISDDELIFVDKTDQSPNKSNSQKSKQTQLSFKPTNTKQIELGSSNTSSDIEIMPEHFNVSSGTNSASKPQIDLKNGQSSKQITSEMFKKRQGDYKTLFGSDLNTPEKPSPQNDQKDSGFYDYDNFEIANNNRISDKSSKGSNKFFDKNSFNKDYQPKKTYQNAQTYGQSKPLDYGGNKKELNYTNSNNTQVRQQLQQNNNSEISLKSNRQLPNTVNNRTIDLRLQKSSNLAAIQVSAATLQEKDRKQDAMVLAQLKVDILKKSGYGKQQEAARQREEDIKRQVEVDRLIELENQKKRLRKEKNSFYDDLMSMSTGQKHNNNDKHANNLEGLLQNPDNITSRNNFISESRQNEIEDQMLMDAEQKRLVLQKIQDQEKEEQMKKIRRENRKNVEELIKPILSLQLIEEFFYGKPKFNKLPINFQDHKQYRDHWIPLFRYEAYNQMINQKSDYERQKQQIEQQGLKFNGKKMYFEGSISKYNQDTNYIYLKLYEQAQPTTGRDGQSYFQSLDKLKEFDLLLISEKPLQTQDAKKIMNAEYLHKMRSESGKMVGIVNRRRKKESDYLQIKIDNSHEEYVMLNIRQGSQLKVHVYFLDSLSTTVREFRTIKSCEFFATADIILNPMIGLKPFNEILTDQSRRMMNFIETNEKSFNQSQAAALQRVAKMNQEDFLLIQGPPGTGKTHTIKGIIAMILKAGVKKILVCAPSNAAIDEIVLRLSTSDLFGTMTSDTLKRKLLRIGSMDYEPLAQVKQHTLDQRLYEEMGEVNNPQQKTNSHNDKANEIKEKLHCIKSITKIINSNNEKSSLPKLNILLRTVLTYAEKMDRFYKKTKGEKLEQLLKLTYLYEKDLSQISGQVNKNPKQRKKKDIEKQIIQQAQIICTTLAMSVSEKLEIIELGGFDYLIVDEACQCVELTNLIPFEHQLNKVILVGDQQQLPATTFSENSDETNYRRSLFERLLENDIHCFMLSIQYRMDPIIRQFPSDRFYNGNLQDAQIVAQRNEDQSLLPIVISQLKQKLKVLTFFDIGYSREENSEQSKTNRDEALFIEGLFTEMLQTLSDSDYYQNKFSNRRDRNRVIMEDLKGKIGIISPYKSQVRILKDIMYSKLRSLEFGTDIIEINTVDAYQGREKDIIIISCVRGGSKNGQIGFLNDYRRMNVAITRAKHFLMIVGNSKTLQSNDHWDALVKYSQSYCEDAFIKFHRKEQWDNGSIFNKKSHQEPQSEPLKINNDDQEQRQKYYQQRKEDEHKKRLRKQRFKDDHKKYGNTNNHSWKKKESSDNNDKSKKDDQSHQIDGNEKQKGLLIKRPNHVINVDQDIQKRENQEKGKQKDQAWNQSSKQESVIIQQSANKKPQDKTEANLWALLGGGEQK